MELHITGDPAADKLLSEDAFALLTGMLLDQQVTMESAFAGPEKIRTRIGLGGTRGHRRPRSARPSWRCSRNGPAVHRFPGSMAASVQALAEAVQGDWDGDATAIWTQGEPDGAEVLRSG